MKDKYIRLSEAISLLKSRYVQSEIVEMLSEVDSIEADVPLPKIGECPLCGSHRTKLKITSDDLGGGCTAYYGEICCENCGIRIEYKSFDLVRRQDKEYISLETIEKWNGLADYRV